MMAIIIPVIFFMLLLLVIYGISLLCLKGVLNLIAHGANRSDVRRPVTVRSQSRFNVRV
ncbi:MAG TPA: hypothetical protein VNH22_04990 [Blastocatellia bacterium]|nr:hypothetical protein [Blastocatellia bacterium]